MYQLIFWTTQPFNHSIQIRTVNQSNQFSKANCRHKELTALMYILYLLLWSRDNHEESIIWHHRHIPNNVSKYPFLQQCLNPHWKFWFDLNLHLRNYCKKSNNLVCQINDDIGVKCMLIENFYSFTHAHISCPQACFASSLLCNVWVHKKMSLSMS